MSQINSDALRIVKESPPGVSMIVGPSGLAITESSKDEDQLLIEQIDLDDCIVPKQFHDVSGYYNRYDVFGLTVRRRDQAPAQFDDIGGEGRAVPFAALEAGALEDEAAAG